MIFSQTGETFIVLDVEYRIQMNIISKHLHRYIRFTIQNVLQLTFEIFVFVLVCNRRVKENQAIKHSLHAKLMSI